MNPSLPATFRRVLVIDDNAAIHQDFQKILAQIGSGTAGGDALSDVENALFGDSPVATSPQNSFEVTYALQGEEGCAKIAAALQAERPFSVAFVDMRMPPGWDGVQTIQRLWQIDPRLQIVICTAYSDYSWHQIIERLGASDRLLILKKPFEPLEVMQLALALSEKRRLTDAAELKLNQMETLVDQRTAELHRTTIIDRLTGLPNRALLHDRLSHALLRSRRDSKRKFAVLFLDFDHFKLVNESLGHEVGDQLLIGIAQRLAEVLRATDTVSSEPDAATAARLGGDEFIVLLDDLSDEADAARVAERILIALAQPFTIDGHEVQCTVSLGITTGAGGYQSAEEMLRDADTALHRAKALGRNRYVLFDGWMHAKARQRLSMENDLRKALSESQLYLEFQPIVSMASRRVMAFEALCRWRHPTRGIVPPSEFIPLAEENGFILELGWWVLDQACNQLSLWQKHLGRLPDLCICVNLSRRQLTASELIPRLRAALAQSGILPHQLKLEITESSIIDDDQTAARALEAIRDLGVQLLIDDFGTGYSALSCLHRFPLSGLKIDRSFVKNVSEQNEYSAIITAIISLARNLKISLIAEGVETAEQATLLQGLGCDLAQGYHFARPLSPADAQAMLLRQSAAAA